MGFREYASLLDSSNKHLTNYGEKKSKNNIQDVGLLAKFRCRMFTAIVYQQTTNNFSVFSLSKVSKLYFHNQFKNHNIQILNNKRLISTFY
jgi:hypothetical protein